uniref:Uncharacterized protein n=1 Tax=Arundo donax TaxID=35708 RepID=A0A0A9GQB5_ARUDO
MALSSARSNCSQPDADQMGVAAVQRLCHRALLGASTKLVCWILMTSVHETDRNAVIDND